MRILKCKSQLTIAFFAAVNHLNGPLRKQSFTLTGSKGQGSWFVMGGFRSDLCVSVFQGSLSVIVIMIDGSEKRSLWRRLLNFRVRMFVKSAVTLLSSSWIICFSYLLGPTSISVINTAKGKQRNYLLLLLLLLLQLMNTFWLVIFFFN